MVTAELHEMDADSTVIETYESLDDAISELIQVGWEDEAMTLITTPVLLWDEEGRIVATITYSPHPGDMDHPLLHVHVMSEPRLQTYMREETEDGYTAVLTTLS